jgi:hypothetical protein
LASVCFFHPSVGQSPNLKFIVTPRRRTPKKARLNFRLAIKIILQRRLAEKKKTFLWHYKILK